MAGEKDKTQQGARGSDDPNAAPAIKQEDLDLVDDTLEDENQDEAALWSEFDEQESGKEAAPDGGAGDGGGDDTSAAGADGAGAADDFDSGEPGSDDDSAASPAGSDADPGGKPDGGDKTPSGDGRAQGDDADIDWANATPEQRAAYDAAQQRLKKLEHAERSNRGRISALQRQIAELTGGQSQSREADPGDGSADGQGQGEAAAGSDQGADDGFLKSDDWKSFRDEYPEVAGPLEKVIGGLQAEVTRQHKELSAIGADRRESALAEQAGLLAEEHSDWQEVVADDSFMEWLEAQPRHIREAAIRNAEDIVDAQEAADVVGRFKAYRSEQQGGGNAQDQQDTTRADGGGGTDNQQARRQRQLESASTTRSRGPGVATGISEDGDPERIWKQFDEMERRQAGGGA